MLTLAHVEAAAARLAGVAVRTPLLENRVLNERTGGRILMKCEGLQHSGSFKFRGAYNRLVQLSPEERRRGVVAWSSGNHAQGVALAARMLGIPAAIVMPSDAPAIKLANTRAYGAECVLYDRYTQNREEIGHSLAAERGAVVVPSYDDHDVMAGQGTIGLQILEDAGARGLAPEVVIAPCSGGGLIAGIATAVKALRPETEIYTAEPAGFDDHARSLKAGEILSNDPAARSICDALQAPSPGALTFDVNRRLLSGGLVVTDDEVRAAIAFAFDVLKLVVEPGGAVALAALLAGRIDARGRTVAIVLSGANIDRALYVEILAKASAARL